MKLISVTLTILFFSSLISLVVISTSVRFSRAESTMDGLFPRDRMILKAKPKVKGDIDIKLDTSNIRKELPQEIVNCLKPNLIKIDNVDEFNVSGLEEKAGFIRVYVKASEKTYIYVGNKIRDKWICTLERDF